MMRRFKTAAALAALGVLTAPALADDDKRFEITFMPAYDSLVGDASDFYDNGPSFSVGFEAALNEPHEKRTFRAISLRLTGGYAGFDGATENTKLEGSLFGLDALVIANLGETIKPYGFVGLGLNNLADDADIVTGSDGIGFAFGVGSKFHFGSSFMALAEVSHQDYTVEGDFDFSPAHVNFIQFRFGIGFRF